MEYCSDFQYCQVGLTVQFGLAIDLAASASPVVGLGKVPNFADLLHRLADRFESKSAFAKALGISPSRLSRALAGDFPLNVANCLRLALLTGESPAAILRAAGKDDVAELLEKLYPGGKSLPITPAQRELLFQWEEVPPRARAALSAIFQDLRQHRFAQEARAAEIEAYEERNALRAKATRKRG